MRSRALVWIPLRQNLISMIYQTSALNSLLYPIPTSQSVPPLPKYVGGSEVHLLLGIKNTNLDPVWIKTLPSGVAVYQSVFKDIWGSDLIFAGQHKTFMLFLVYILLLGNLNMTMTRGQMNENTPLLLILI